MSEAANTPAAGRTRLIVSLAVAAGLLLLLGANWHLVYVAFTSQPDCVAHLKQGESRPGGFSAARSACSAP